jgi:uncharacterized protein
MEERMSVLPERTLKPWHACVAFVVGGGIAQFGSLLVAAVLAIMLSLRRGGLDEPAIQALAADFSVIGPAALTVGLLLLAASIATPVLAGVRLRTALGLRPPPLWPTLACVFGIAGLAPTSELLVTVMQRIAPELTFGTLEALDRIVAENPIWLLWPVIALSPGICEEMFFRGMIQRAFRPGILAIVISGVSFALFHVDPHHVIGVLPIGLYLAWVAQRTGSTWTTVIAHVANNTASIVAAKAGGDSSEAESTPWWVSPIGLALVAVTVVLIVRATRPVTPPPSPLPAAG